MKRWILSFSCLALFFLSLSNCAASGGGGTGPAMKSADRAPTATTSMPQGAEAVEATGHVRSTEDEEAARLDPQEENGQPPSSQSFGSEADAPASKAVEDQATGVSKHEADAPPSYEQGSTEEEDPSTEIASNEKAEKPPKTDQGGNGSSSADAETKEKEVPSPGRDSFAHWLMGLKSRAANAGVSQETLDKLDTIQPIGRVIELDRRQPERRFTLQEYLARVVPDSRVEEGRRRYAEHRELLEEIGEKYGVHPRFLVAFWGIETDYGRNTGGFRVLDALATLAHEGRRAAFFETELINALKIIDGGHISPDEMLGSWAGALGQCQFMPSSFMSYAVDHTGDGRRDIWNNLPDVFASSANYLVRHGWQRGQTWGRLVRLPDDFDRSLLGLDTKKSLEEWQALGVRRPDGQNLPTANFDGSLVQPGGPNGPTYLVYDNYRTIMRWNRSHYFATAVGLLADRIASP